MLKHMDLGNQSPVEVREAQSVNGPLAVLNEYYDVYVTQPEDAKWRLDNMHDTYLQDMNSKYVYPNVFMSIDDTNKVSQYDTDSDMLLPLKSYDFEEGASCSIAWKLQFSASSSIIIIEDYYLQTFLHSLEKVNSSASRWWNLEFHFLH